jgi:hypothetical protein
MSLGGFRPVPGALRLPGLRYYVYCGVQQSVPPFGRATFFVLPKKVAKERRFPDTTIPRSGAASGFSYATSPVSSTGQALSRPKTLDILSSALRVSGSFGLQALIRSDPHPRQSVAKTRFA